MSQIKKYLSEIGKKGGLKSRRTLTTEQAKEMIAARETKRDQGKRNVSNVEQ